MRQSSLHQLPSTDRALQTIPEDRRHTKASAECSRYHDSHECRRATSRESWRSMYHLRRADTSWDNSEKFPIVIIIIQYGFLKWPQLTWWYCNDCRVGVHWSCSLHSQSDIRTHFEEWSASFSIADRCLAGTRPFLPYASWTGDTIPPTTWWPSSRKWSRANSKLNNQWSSYIWFYLYLLCSLLLEIFKYWIILSRTV